MAISPGFVILNLMGRRIRWWAFGSIVFVTAAAFTFGYQDEEARARREFRENPPAFDLGDRQLNRIMSEEMRPLFEDDRYWSFVWSKVREVEPDAATQTTDELTTGLIRDGVKRLSREDLLELNGVWAVASGRSMPACVALWRGGAPDALILGRLGEAEVRTAGRLNRTAALLELESGGAPPMSEKEVEEALVQGMEAIAKQLGSGAISFLELASKGLDVTDFEACSLSRKMFRAVPHMKPELQERFLRALVTAAKE